MSKMIICRNVVENALGIPRRRRSRNQAEADAKEIRTLRKALELACASLWPFGEYYGTSRESIREKFLKDAEEAIRDGD